tara:strand:- start:17857 stop:18498 length:642 start_codon:yes stop_codon:yes gene_type:complete
MDSRKLYTDLSELLEASLLGFADPVLLRRIFLLHARDLFSDPDNYGNYDELKELLYTDNKSTRTLDIDLDFIYDSEEISKKPAIYVGTGPIQFEKQVIDNSAGAPQDGVSVTTLQAKTSIQIKHVSNQADVSLMLGGISTNYFGAIRDTMFNNFPNVLRYEIKELSGPSLIEGTKIRSFQTNLSIDLAFDALWSTVRESHLIKSVSIDARPAG